jgi:hypothetical protein
VNEGGNSVLAPRATLSECVSESRSNSTLYWDSPGFAEYVCTRGGKQGLMSVVATVVEIAMDITLRSVSEWMYTIEYIESGSQRFIEPLKSVPKRVECACETDFICTTQHQSLTRMADSTMWR